MLNTRLGAVAAAAMMILVTTTGAQATCSNQWADVLITCPNPVPYTGPKTLTDTSRNMPTVGKPGVYGPYGNGYDVKVVLHGAGSGYQPFAWEKR